jgi:ATP-binding cassette subfamily F protein 3
MSLYDDSGKPRLTQLLQQQTELKRELANVEECWIEASAELEAAEA